MNENHNYPTKGPVKVAILRTSLDFQSGYDAASKAKQLIIDSIRAETIEECVRVIEQWENDTKPRSYLDLIAAIRALKDKL